MEKLKMIKGGEGKTIDTDRAVGLVVLGSFLFLVLVRKGFKGVLG